MYPVREHMELVVPDWETVAPVWEHLKIVLPDRDTKIFKRGLYIPYGNS